MELAPSAVVPLEAASPTEEARDGLLHELAYRCAVNGGRRVSEFATGMDLSRSDYGDLVMDPRFEDLLEGYTRAYVELPYHKDLSHRRMDAAAGSGLEGLTKALTRGDGMMRLTERVTTERSVEGAPNELLAAFKESLGDRGRSAFAVPEPDRGVSGDIPDSSGPIRGEVLSPGVQGRPGGQDKGAPDS